MLSVMRHPHECYHCWGFRLYESFIAQTNKVGFFPLSSTILSFLTLKCNLLLFLIELCSYLYVSLWHNQWNNFNISFTLILLFLERPLSHLSCDSTFGVYCFLVALFYLTKWMEIAAVKGSLAPIPDFLSLFLDYSNSFFFKEVFRAFQKKLLDEFLHWSSWQPVPLCYTSLSVEVNSMKSAKRHSQSMYPCILCLCVPLSCLVSWEIGQNFITLLDVTWEQPKRVVSPVWRRKCCLRNPECFCVGGHWVTAEINPLLYILPLVFIHGEVGQRLFQHLC